MPKTLIITSCTGEKKYHPENQLLQADFEDSQKLSSREQELSQYALPAGEMYTGMQHLRLMDGIKLLRENFGHSIVDLFIVSAGYGLIAEDRMVVPYEVTFNSMNSSSILSWSRKLQIHKDLNQLVSQYDLVIFLLGDKYLKAIELPFEEARQEQRLVFLASGMSKKMIPAQPPYFFVEVGQEDATSFSYGLVGLKGLLFKYLSQEVVQNGSGLFEEIYNNPNSLMTILEKYRKKKTSAPEQLLLFDLGQPEPIKKKKAPQTKKGLDIVLPPSEFAANYTAHMRYFIPEWDDRVEPGYDFLTDTGKEDRDTYKDDVYAHEIYPIPNYDGILFSKVIVEESKKKKALIEKMGVHDFVRFPKNRPIMGDCGAFGYINQYEPPFQTSEILEYYQSLGFNIGVSIDHLIVGKYAADIGERNRRYKLTSDNAAEFLQKYKEGHYTFLPSGIAQGWDPKSYRDAVATLIEMGYKHISLGGLVHTTSKDIIEILKVIKPLIPDYLQIHLFGVARIEAVQPFAHLGVTAFDSASPLRRAWLGAGGNYFGTDGTKYAAIRIPPVDGHGVRVKKMIEEGKGTYEQFKAMEKASLAAIRGYDKGVVSLEEALETILEYDELIGDGREIHKKSYRETLENKPWKQCDCEICRNIGVDVIIFRGNNRNRRRGFHNTYVFYKQFKELFPDTEEVAP